MEFSLSWVGKENMHYFESETESRLQLVFVPGGLNPEIWNQQLRYFSKSFKTVSFQPTVSFRDFEGEKKALENILDQEQMKNVVLVSHTFGNSVIQDFEDHDNVVSTVLTSPRRSFDKILPRRLADLGFSITKFKPKIAKKMFFGDKTEYRIVKEFMNTIEKPDYKDFKSFIDNYKVSRPEKDSMVIHPEKDPFSSIDFAQELKPNASISCLQDSGTFSFYEKPQEYNKALLDFLNAIDEQVESEELIEIRKNNHSLLEYEGKSGKKLRTKPQKVEV